MAEARNCLSRLAEVPATLPRPSGSAHLVADFDTLFLSTPQTQRELLSHVEVGGPAFGADHCAQRLGEDQAQRARPLLTALLLSPLQQ